MAVDQTSRALLTPGRPEIRPEGTTTRRLGNYVHRLYRLLTERPLSLYAAAFLRIGLGLLILVFLLREFPYRQQIWGPDSPWSPDLARQMSDQNGWFTLLTLSDSRWYFEACYAVAVLTALLFMLGWRTRAVSILFAIVMASFRGRNLVIVDGGDRLAYLVVVYLAFTACGRRWSLDARRARRRVARHLQEARPPSGDQAMSLRAQAGAARQFAVTVLHNCAILVIMAQVCIVYGAASLYKVQGNVWVDGTAMHYVVNLESFQPWPALSHFIDSHHMFVAFVTYLTVLVQVAFPFTLFSNLKYLVLAILVSMHLGIAVLMGMPIFAGVMIVADAVFLPDRFYQWVARMWWRLRHARRRSPALDEP